MGRVAREFAEQFDDLLAHDRVEPVRRLVEQKELRVVRERRGDRNLHFVAARKLRKWLFLRHAQPFEQRRVRVLRPAAVGALQHLPELHGRQARGHARLVEHDADLLLHPPKLRAVVVPQHRNVAAVARRHVENQADQRAFARAVFADQPQDAAARQSQVDGAEPKARVGFHEAADLNCVCHFKIVLSSPKQLPRCAQRAGMRAVPLTTPRTACAARRRRPPPRARRPPPARWPPAGGFPSASGAPRAAAPCSSGRQSSPWPPRCR